MTISLSIILAYLLDLVLGDPEGFPHPVRVMGRFINFLDNKLRGNAGKWKEQIKGIIFAILVVGISTYLAYLLILYSKKIDPFLGNLVWVYLGYSSLSIKDLRIKVKDILKELEKNSITEARKQLSKIVGRDTQHLSKDKIITATIESIAESNNDGIIAPLFYLILGGPVLAISYKAINTLDSMVGYKNDKYLHFGWFSAKLDDLANFIPSRLCGFLISASSFILGKGFKDSFKIMFRDGKKHPSPNSGIPEAAMAGSLGIKLGGDAFYQGRLSKRPFLGEEKREINHKLITEALDISLVSSLLLVILGTSLRWKI